MYIHSVNYQQSPPLTWAGLLRKRSPSQGTNRGADQGERSAHCSLLPRASQRLISHELIFKLEIIQRTNQYIFFLVSVTIVSFH